MDVTKLPINWNDNHELFKLDYSYKKNLFYLTLVKRDGLIQITLLVSHCHWLKSKLLNVIFLWVFLQKSSTKTSKIIILTIDASINVTKGALKEVFPTLETFLLCLRDKLIPNDFINAECTSSSSSNERYCISTNKNENKCRKKIGQDLYKKCLEKSINTKLI